MQYPTAFVRSPFLIRTDAAKQILCQKSAYAHFFYAMLILRAASNRLHRRRRVRRMEPHLPGTRTQRERPANCLGLILSTSCIRDRFDNSQYVPAADSLKWTIRPFPYG